MQGNSSSNSSLHPLLDEWQNLRECASVFTALFISLILLLPLLIFVLYVGYQRWRKQRSVATAAMINHSDVFTFNMVVMELISISGLGFYCNGTFTNRLSVIIVGLYIFSISSPGQTLFHLLTCVERYLAVVHPVTYRGLRRAGGVRIRNISIGCVWLLCFGSPGLSKIGLLYSTIYNFILLVFCFIVVSFCSLSVLCVLIRPGPGEVGGKRKRVDKSKQRAFYTMIAIMAALLLRFLSLVSIATFASLVSGFSDLCWVAWSSAWFCLPSSLVLPLLFLHRAGKLQVFKHNTASS